MATERAKGFITFTENGEQISMLSDEEAGKLYKALIAYQATGEETELPPMAKLMFSIMRRRIDENNEAYLEKCRRLAENKKKKAEVRETPADIKADIKAEVKDDISVTSGCNSNSNSKPKPNTKPIVSNDTKDTSPNGDVAPSAQSKSKSRPESVDAVREYRQSLGYQGFDAQRFCDYYDANGWVQGRGKPIKDWKAALRNWQKMRKEFDPPSIVGTPPPIDKGFKKVVVEPVYTTEKTNNGFFTRLLKESEGKDAD